MSELRRYPDVMYTPGLGHALTHGYLLDLESLCTGWSGKAFGTVWMSYKWLSHCGVYPSSGPIIQFQKKTSFVQDSQISYWLQLVCLRTPLLLYGFQSNLVSLESYAWGESSAVCYEAWGLLLMENGGNYRNCATQIILEILAHIKSGFLLSGCSPSHLGCSPSILHRWKWSLVWIQGRNMGLVSRILRVWLILLLEWACRSEFHL